ncbi:alpha-N-acetylgalactosamine-specific lectin-like [Acanthaster planci]|uniref:Alpha-N-acetylgalactosamine-specific lectin-like n=1 Tax=Acanthaster planci TaxID=133434 RepID=A0A8B7YEQ6_ACAPL|nr:alpha-N-acetylgalactosamine-specific lectin-like [Acanthaster planci]
MKTSVFTAIAIFLILGRSVKISDGYCPCHPPWVAYYQHCYLVVLEPKAYQSAEDHCLTYSRGVRQCHLASVVNAEEYDFIVNLAREASVKESGIWLGLNDRLETSNFVWTDGSNSSFNRWYHIDEPDASNNCVRTDANHEYRMNDKSCSTKLASVCKALQTLDSPVLLAMLVTNTFSSTDLGAATILPPMCTQAVRLSSNEHSSTVRR